MLTIVSTKDYFVLSIIPFIGSYLALNRFTGLVLLNVCNGII